MFRRRCYFTLVELLVVVAVIGILAALLLPVLSVAVDKARGIACQSAAKQIATGFTIYAMESDGMMVAGRMAKSTVAHENLYDVGNGQKYRPRWYAQLGFAAGVFAFSEPSPLKADDNTQCVDNKLYICPAAPDVTNGRNYTYGYNFQFLGNSRKNLSGTDYVNWPRRLDRLAKPADTVMFADNLGTAAGKPADQRLPYNDLPRDHADSSWMGAESPYRLQNHAWALDPPRLVAGSSDFCNDHTRTAAGRSAVDERHAGKATVLFCDGHAEARSARELGYTQADDGSFTLDGDNRRFSGTSQDDDPPDIN